MPRKKKRSPERISRAEYYAYINSQTWRQKREQYFASKLPQGCMVCKTNKIDLHHRTYKRLGSEWLNDLVPLCRTHHDECHKFIKKHKLNLWGGTKIFIRTRLEGSKNA